MVQYAPRNIGERTNLVKRERQNAHWMTVVAALSVLPLAAFADVGAGAASDAGRIAAGWSRMSPEQRREHERELVHALAELELQPPWIDTRMAGRKYRPENLKFAMNAGVAETPKGRLWAVWFGGEDNADAFMLGAKSDDGGRTWSAPQFVVDTHFPGNKVFGVTVKRSVLVGEIWCAPDGTLRLYVNQSLESFDGRGSTWEFVCRDPNADKPDWGRPRYIWHGLQHNKPTVATTGEWIMPLNLSIGHAGLFPELDALRGAGMLVSQDRGETWQPRGFVRVKDSWECCENMIVERHDGSWVNFMRTDFGIMQCESRDRGQTWTGPVPMPGVRHPVSRFSITRLPSGNWLFVKNGRTVDSFDKKNERTLLTAWLSEDEGATWKGGLMLDGRPRSKDYGACYPDVCLCRDGSICATWDYDRRVSAEIGFARFTEDDVRAGRIVSPRSFLGVKITAAVKEKGKKP